MTTRRTLLLAFGGALAAPLAPYAQQPAKIPRIGVMAGPASRAAFQQGMREHGWIEGKNIVVEYRDIAGRPERLPDIAREMINLKVDCIVAGGNVAINALKQATSSIPIVMASAADAIGSKFIVSLPQPGGNITGLTNIMEALTAKRLELLKAFSPGMSRVAILKNPTVAAHNSAWQEAQSAAQSLGLKVFAADLRDGDDFENVFAAIAREKAGGLMVLQNPVVNAARSRIAGLATKHRLPAVYQDSMFVEAGGLMSYGADQADLWRRSARYVDKILKGAKPSDLPVEQPTKFELIINGKTAKTLGLTIPQALLISANKVIE